MEKVTKKKISVIFLSFYNSYPITSGASNISTNFYKHCPFEKKLFLINHEKKLKIKNIHNFKPINNKPIFKFFVLFPYIWKLFQNIFNNKPNIIIFEGASWVGYSFLFFIILKTFLKNIKFIYHSHNIDFEIRKKSFLLSKLTFLLEKYLVNNVDIFTVVSKKDKKNIYKLYKKKVYIVNNGVDIYKKKNNKFKKNIVLFSGSLEFSENRSAFNNFYRKVYPLIKANYKNFKIVISGNKTKFNLNKDILQVGVLEYSKYLDLLKKTKLCVYPFKKGPGTKIKVIEALCNDTPVLTTKYGFNGINLKNRKKFIYKNNTEFNQKIKSMLEKKSLNTFRSIFFDAKKKYNMKNISNDFFSKL